VSLSVILYWPHRGIIDAVQGLEEDEQKVEVWFFSATKIRVDSDSNDRGVFFFLGIRDSGLLCRLASKFLPARLLYKLEKAICRFVMCSLGAPFFASIWKNVDRVYIDFSSIHKHPYFEFFKKSMSHVQICFVNHGRMLDLDAVGSKDFSFAKSNDMVVCRTSFEYEWWRSNGSRVGFFGRILFTPPQSNTWIPSNVNKQADFSTPAILVVDRLAGLYCSRGEIKSVAEALIELSVRGATIVLLEPALPGKTEDLSIASYIRQKRAENKNIFFVPGLKCLKEQLLVQPIQFQLAIGSNSGLSIDCAYSDVPFLDFSMVLDGRSEYSGPRGVSTSCSAHAFRSHVRSNELVEVVNTARKKMQIWVANERESHLRSVEHGC
jgi:hypothetical protein